MTVFCLHCCSLPDAAKIHIHHVQKLCSGCLRDRLRRAANGETKVRWTASAFQAPGQGKRQGIWLFCKKSIPVIEGWTKLLSWPEIYYDYLGWERWIRNIGKIIKLILIVLLSGRFDSGMQYNTQPALVTAAGQQWRRCNLNCISSRSPDCVAKTETPLFVSPVGVFQTVSSSVLCAALNAGSSTPSPPFRLYLQKHTHKNIFIVHNICPAMTPHKTSTLKIWGVNTLDSSLQTLREVVLSMCLIKSCYVFIYLFI